jgi:hypothetical protein
MPGLLISLSVYRQMSKAKEKGTTEAEEDGGTSLTLIILPKGLDLFAMIFSPMLRPREHRRGGGGAKRRKFATRRSRTDPILPESIFGLRRPSPRAACARWERCRCS